MIKIHFEVVTQWRDRKNDMTIAIDFYLDDPLTTTFITEIYHGRGIRVEESIMDLLMT